MSEFISSRAQPPTPEDIDTNPLDAAALMTQAVTAIVRPDSISIAERERLAAALRLHRTWLLGWVALIEAEGRDDAEARIAAIRAKLQQQDIKLPLPLRAMTGRVSA